MLCLTCFSKFPIFFSSSGEVLGARYPNDEFMQYCYKIHRAGFKSVVVGALGGISFRSAFVFEGLAINPWAKQKFVAPKHIFVPYDDSPRRAPVYVYARGFTLLCPRGKVFVPLMGLSSLTPDVARELKIALVAMMSKRGSVVLGDLIKILDRLGIRVLSQKNTVFGEVLHLKDDVKNICYYVLLRGPIVVDSNICVTFGERVNILEFAILVRGVGEVVTYAPENFEWYPG